MLKDDGGWVEFTSNALTAVDLGLNEIGVNLNLDKLDRSLYKTIRPVDKFLQRQIDDLESVGKELVAHQIGIGISFSFLDYSKLYNSNLFKNNIYLRAAKQINLSIFHVTGGKAKKHQLDWSKDLINTLQKKDKKNRSSITKSFEYIYNKVF